MLRRLNQPTIHSTVVHLTRMLSSLSRHVNSIGQPSTNSKLRTHKCGEIDDTDVGAHVKLAGWLEYKRGKFFTLRDASGSCQVLCGPDAQLPSKESVLDVEGIVKLRPAAQVNPKMATGSIEVHSTNVETLNTCTHLPYPVHDSPKEEVRMRYRYIDLRSKKMQRNLRMRSSFILDLRKYLCEEQDFVDIETPTLFRRTPGGAKEFIVPTQKAGMFYSLPQSPQQFKQLLMAGAVDRYMQVAKCYRDEGAKPERQPEFTQLDLELSFTNQEQVKALIEEMVMKCWPKELHALTIPFPRLSYTEAIENYGTDKPDTRFGSTIVDITDIFGDCFEGKYRCVKAINIRNGCELLRPKDIKRTLQLVRTQYEVNIGIVKLEPGEVWNSALTKYLPTKKAEPLVNRALEAQHNDIIFLCANHSWKTACEALGMVRTLVAQLCADNGTPLHNGNPFDFLWVEEFPLFEEEHSTLYSSHHPFTAPVEQDMPLLYSDPAKVKGQHYDLVLNGCEIGGGSIRIHNSRVQRYILEQILNEDVTQLEHLLQALDSGCPPHGGIALGLDRLLSIMCNEPTIRDVIAFPKSSKGADLMTGAPCKVDDSELQDYHISVFNHANVD